MSVQAGSYGSVDVAALSADAGHKQRRFRRKFTYACDFSGLRGAHDQPNLTVDVPGTRSHLGNALVDHVAVLGDELLNVGATRVGRAAQQNHAAAFVFEIGFDGIKTHVGRKRHRISLVSHECFLGVLLGRGPDVAALGIENDGNVGVLFVNVCNDLFKRFFQTFAREVGDLRLEGADVRCGGVHDGTAELQNTFGVFGQMSGQTFEIGIKSHAEHGVNGVDSLVEFFDEHDVAFSFTKRKAENAFRKNRFFLRLNLTAPVRANGWQQAKTRRLGKH